MSAERRGIALAALVVALVGLTTTTGCYGRDTIRALVSDTGQAVPVIYESQVIVIDAKSRKPINDAVVYLSHDEDAVTQIAWTDHSGSATLLQSYISGTTVVHERVLLGFASQEVSTEIRYPERRLRAARAGYLPDEMTLAPASFAMGLDVSNNGARVSMDQPATLALEAAGRSTRAEAHVGQLFAAPPQHAVKLGLRTSPSSGLFSRFDSGRVQTAGRAYLGPNGEEIVVFAVLEAGLARYHRRLSALANSCRRGFYVAPDVLRPEASQTQHAWRAVLNRMGVIKHRAFSGSSWTVLPTDHERPSVLSVPSESRLARALRLWHGEGAESDEATRLVAMAYSDSLVKAATADDSVSDGRILAEVLKQIGVETGTVAIICPPRLAQHVGHQLLIRRYRPIAECWLSAWTVR